jgi:predicted permease
MTMFFFHHGKKRRNVIIIGGAILAIGFIGMITMGHLVIKDTVNNNLTPNGYPKTQILGISVYSFEYASLFLTVFGVFLFTGGLIAMDSKKKQKQNKNV